MGKVIYNGREFRIKHKRRLYSENGPNRTYAIFDDESYMCFAKFYCTKLDAYQRAVQLSDKTKPGLKIVLNFAPYAVNPYTLKNLDYSHSLWIKPGYRRKDLSAFRKTLNNILKE